MKARRLVLMSAAILLATSVSLAATAYAQEQTTDQQGAQFAVAAVKTKTFSKPSSILIPSGGTAAPYPSTINVSGFKKGKITDVNVKIRGYIHTFPDDVDVLLKGPKGQNAIIMSDAGGSNAVNGVNFTVDDEAPIFFPDSGAINQPSYKPSNYEVGDAFPTQTPSGNVPLSVFDGKNPNGQWKLYVVDDLGGFSGQFAGGWALQIKAKVRR